MKILCITGSAQRDLDQLLNIFHNAGVAGPQAAVDNPSLDMASLHEQMRAIHTDSAAPDKPGRLWDALASEIFMANMRTELWGWADTGSADFLDFWLEFEPRIYFLLAWSSAPHTLALALESGAKADAIASILDEWEARQAQILQFHQRHPERSLLVNMRESVTHAPNLLAQCTEHLHLPLRTAQEMPAPAPGEDPLLLFFAQQLSTDRARTGELEQALAAATLPLGTSPNQPGAAPTLHAALTTYQQHRESLSNAVALAQAQAVDLTTLRLQLRDSRATAAEESTGLRAQLQQLRADMASLSTAYQQDKEDWTRANEAWKMERQDLLDRHSYAEEDMQRAASLQAGTSRQLQEAELELELALKQRLRVEQEAAHFYAQHEAILARAVAAESNWNEFLQSTPGFYRYASLEVAAAGMGALDWHLTVLETAGHPPADLRFHTQYDNGAAAIMFSATAADASPTCISEAELDQLPDMSTSHWQLLQTLVRIVLAALAQPERLALPPELPAAQWHQAMDRLARRLAAFDDVLRFDRVELKRAQTNPDYEHLWLQLGQLSCGAHRWPSAEFRLACANVQPDQFGSHPKLEFPQTAGQALLEHWWQESADDFGSKMELRFALPDAVDLGVWQRLSARDQHLLRALIARLPAILTSLQSSHPALPRPWADWDTLAGTMQSIVERQTVAPATVEK